MICIPDGGVLTEPVVQFSRQPKPKNIMIFSPLDWLILAVYLAGMVAIGFRISKRQTSTREFFLGGQRYGSIAMSISVLATGLSRNHAVRFGILR